MCNVEKLLGEHQANKLASLKDASLAWNYVQPTEWVTNGRNY